MKILIDDDGVVEEVVLDEYLAHNFKLAMAFMDTSPSEIIEELISTYVAELQRATSFRIKH